MIRKLSTVILLLAVLSSTAIAADAKRGEYLIRMGGCLGCHTEDRKEAPPFAGGRALKTPFGIFYGPNITSHTATGIGKWTEADFFRAMRHGIRPDGANYFPAFPYPSFTKITQNDLRDMWAYLQTIAPVARSNQPHQLRFPFGWRPAVKLWNWLYLEAGEDMAVNANAEVNRGRYLVQALSHCGECHTPRNFLGAPIRGRMLAGGKGADGGRVPNLTPKRLESWSDRDFRTFFTSGLDPDGDTTAESMAEVIRNTTSHMTSEDMNAMIAYLRSLSPLDDKAP